MLVPGSEVEVPAVPVGSAVLPAVAGSVLLVPGPLLVPLVGSSVVAEDAAELVVPRRRCCRRCW
ncbi:hypothetical protein [Nannocystis pusilla]|uniref:hypothetical protein n=1 Tax=Nannocystis pusilla TaxID=889268 RepID=UPI003B81F839